MTILDKARGKDKQSSDSSKRLNDKTSKSQEAEAGKDSSGSELLTQVESQFKAMMQEFQANKGFAVNTGEQPVDTMVELLSSSGVNVSIVLLLSYIRYCINHGLKKDITLKIGYNKPAAIPMNFAVNEELLEEIFPGDVVEIN